MGKGRGFEYGSEWVNRHHLIAQERWWTNHENNILIMPVIRHRALHILHWNSLPVQQLQETLGINSTAFCDDFRFEVWKLLDTWAKEGKWAYDPNVFKKNRQV